MRFYGVVSDFLDEAVELFPTREEAAAVVLAWDEDEPERAAALHVEPIELVTGGPN
jgi:hypothetical protein